MARSARTLSEPVLELARVRKGVGALAAGLARRGVKPGGATLAVEMALDRLLGAAERLVPRGDYRGGAALLVREVPTNRSDDRAIVMLWREY